MKNILKTAIFAAILGLPLQAHAQASEIGEREYTNSCAQCHGPTGKGDGAMASYLMGKLPDLSALQRDNGGVFPFVRVYDIVEGGVIVGPHGSREMPAWGNRYTRQAPKQLGLDYSPMDREAFVRGRILALIEYISTFQEE